jgi:hypothetical protein
MKRQLAEFVRAFALKWSIGSMIKTLIAAVALTISLAGYADAQEAAYHHTHHHRRHIFQPAPYSDALGPSYQWSTVSPYAQYSPVGPTSQGFTASDSSCFDPIKCAQTSGHYAGR